MGAVVALLCLPILAMLDGNKAGLRCPGCPDNLIQIVHNNQRGAQPAQPPAPAGLGAAPRDRRRAHPALAAGQRGAPPRGGAGAGRGVRHASWPSAATATLDLFGDPLSSLPANVFFYLTATVPIAVLYVFLQRQLARGGVAGLVVELGTPSAGADLRQALARTLGDPSLELAFWFPAERCYVDGDGAPVRLPEDDGGRRATLVERDGQPIAALLHDPVLERQRRARAVGVRGGEPRAGERAPAGRAAGAAGRAAGVAGAAGRAPPTPSGGGSSATCTTAPSSGSSRSRCRSGCWSPSCPRRRRRRRPLAARDARGAGAGARGAARADPRHQPAAARRARAWRRRSTSCAAAPRCPTHLRLDARPAPARTRSRAPPTSSPARRSPTRPSTRTPARSAWSRRCAGRDADRRGRRRRHRRRRHRRRLGAARAGRSRRGARRPLHRLQPAGARHDAARGDPVRVALADDAVLLREGLARLLTEAGFEVVGPGRRRRRAAGAGGAHPPGRRDRRHPDAADAHRRGAARGQGHPRALAGGRHPRALPARQRPLRARAALDRDRRRRLPAQGARV